MLVSQRDPEAFSGGKTGLRAPSWTGWTPVSLKQASSGSGENMLGEMGETWGNHVPSGKLTCCDGKWPLIVDLPIKIVIFHSNVNLPEAS